MKPREFTASLEAMGEGGAWTGLVVPFEVEKEFGSKARVPVTGTINGFPFRTSLFPDGNGAHVLMVNKEMQKGGKRLNR